ncbi:BA75_03744T0 [Komagataella pastoris]|uniref:rRNA methyltransferase 1, mitochondrial n=1 Tax=Komagataella pastoris TaxID=4922 RepID=A0A1B2JGI5_PICPA|nr:BA75_03744T0 [Komagataella pastoris]
MNRLSVLRLNGVRRFSWSKSALIRAPFKNFDNDRIVSGGKSISFNRNMPNNSRVKAWEKDGEDKDTWFRRKYAHVHAKQKQVRQDKEAARAQKSASKNPELSPDSKQIRRNRPPKENPLEERIFGAQAVLAALKANNREFLSTLYVHNPKDKHEEITELCKQRGVDIKLVDSKNDLNLLCNNNVHNGYVLKAAKFQTRELAALSRVTSEGVFSLTLQDYGVRSEEQLEVQRLNGKYPLGVYIDGVSDPHNLGAIIRSAYYLGADFVAIAEKNCAPLNSVASKSSAGCMEFLPIFNVVKPLQFLETANENGWATVAAVSSVAKKHADRELLSEELSPTLLEQPCLLIVGSEGDGIRKSLLDRSSFLVSLKGQRKDLDSSVDSLNVSVATAVLLRDFTI